MMLKNKYIIIFILFVLFTTDLLLLYNHFKKQNLIIKLNRQVQILENSNLDNKMESAIDFIPLDAINIETKPTRLLLISFLTEQGCGSCLQAEIIYLNTIYSKYKDYLIVFYDGHPDILKSFNAKFKFQNTNRLKRQFNLPLRFDNPVSILVDSYGSVQSYHKAVVSDPEASANFYFKINSILKSVYEN